MIARIRSLGLFGIGGYEVAVEIFLSGGLPQFDLVGLPDAAIREARERVRAALKNNGLSFPVSRVTVNLAPADKKKNGTVYDLPIAMGILAASGQAPMPREDEAFIGELSLSGELRSVRGALPMALSAAAAGIKRLYLPYENAAEAAFAEGVEVCGIRDLRELLSVLRGETEANPVPYHEPTVDGIIPDFSEVRGQENVKRALEVAAAGGHNVLLVGPPGSGKSMLAKRLPGILPDMSRSEQLESTGIWSVCGLTDAQHPILTARPFRSPHHTLSAAAMAGGALLQPGEVSLAHNGVLFLDELPEFRRDVLEVLRQPLEDREVTVSRAAGTAVYPAGFMLLCAMNPCKCGWYGQGNRCTCTEKSVKAYHSRISGPLLDRIDIIVEVPALEYEELRAKNESESSRTIKARVDAARSIQRQRMGESACNARMSVRDMEKYCTLTAEGEKLMEDAYSAMGLTARSYDRILRVARTIADLAGEEEISPVHLAEAIQYRTYDMFFGSERA
ncbi:MAG: YifB family Mg chelatase-like AAA ATPase [Oscillospiraceae bacterium]|nr:YifB family Mg chelatase-like AAA ATPase [Oscillospiraceae bacterium]